MRRRPHLIPALVATAMLLLAVAELPYGYYQILRWVVCGVAVYIAYMAYRWGKVWAILFGSSSLFLKESGQKQTGGKP